MAKVGRPKGSGKRGPGRPKGSVSKNGTKETCNDVLAKLALNQVEITNKFNALSELVQKLVESSGNSEAKNILSAVIEAPKLGDVASTKETGKSLVEKLDTVNL